LKEILPATWVFQSGDRLSLVQIGLFSYNDERHVSLERNPFVSRAVASSTSFPYENRVLLKGILPAYQSFQGRERLIFL
jgi:hypothetical protein